MTVSKNREQKILTLENLDTIYLLEMQNLSEEIEEEAERAMASWNAKWKKESLEFYLPKGWSFGIFDQVSKLLGYFLGQPLVYFRGQTQTLWVEHLYAADETIKSELVHLAYGYARDKHFQRVLFSEEFGLGPILQNYRAKKLQDEITEVSIR